jgi:hypothetical protein
MRTIFKALLALAAVGATQAHPYDPSCTTTLAAQPAPTAAQPAPTADAIADAQLSRDLLSAPTAIQRFQRLLVKGGRLLTGDALKRLIVFDFNGAQPTGGAKGGVSKAAVSITPHH